MEPNSGCDEIDGYAGEVGLMFDFDPTMLEPFQRCRANTWHGRARIDDRLAADDDKRSTLSSGVDSPGEPSDLPSCGTLNADSPVGTAKTASRKPATRKNAWGNLSYAELIAQAIDSSPDKRLTLAQIYDWMVTNVPYFKDKGESNSSAGWKNSIRHNLSLHNRFVRVHNEGAGKSSWWVNNPDAAVARTTKSPRRSRAFTLDTKAYERQRRSRAQRQGRDLLTRAPAGSTSAESCVVVVDSSSSSVNEEPRDPFGLEYRTRASSFAGPLSPIDARLEPDTTDTMDYSSASRYQYDARTDHFPYVVDSQETLSETLADILAGDLNMSNISSTSSGANPPSQQAGYVKSGYDPTVPFLPPADFRRGPVSGFLSGSEHGNSNHGSNSDVSSSGYYGCCHSPDAGNLSMRGIGVRNRALNVDHGVTGSMPNLSQLLTAPPLYQNTCMSRVDDLKPKSFTLDACQPHPTDFATTSSNFMALKASSSCGMMPPYFGGTESERGCYSNLLGRPDEQRSTSQRLDQTTVTRILSERPHLIGKMQKLMELKRQQYQQQPVANHQSINVDNYKTDFYQQSSCGMVPQSTTAASVPPVEQEPFSDSSTNAFFPSDLDLNGVDFAGVAMDCDIDQVIRHELALDGKLDFMFDSLPTPTK